MAKASQQRSVAAQKERSAAELEDLMSMVAEVDKIAGDIEADAVQTRKMMQVRKDWR